MQDLLHGVMGLIGMGHLQVQEGERKPERGRRVSKGVKKGRGREGKRGRKERKGGMSSSMNNMERAFYMEAVISRHVELQHYTVT